MKKILMLVLAVCIISCRAYCKDTPVMKAGAPIPPHEENRGPGNPELAGTVKEILDIQKRMSDIERSTIHQDQDLKQIALQIKALQEQLRGKLQDKLKNNEEYQSLKQRRNQIKAQYIKVGHKKTEQSPGMKTNQ